MESESNESDQQQFFFQGSRNPFAHLATASWQPLSSHELQQIYSQHEPPPYQDYYFQVD